MTGFDQPPLTEQIASVRRGDQSPPADMRSHHRNPWILRLLAAGAVVVGLVGSGLTASSSGDLQSQISAAQSAAGALKAQIAADSSEIANTTNGLAQARARLASLQSTLDGRVAELETVQTSLLNARDRLVDLENRLHAATTALAANLVAGYEGSQPDLVTVILNSHGFGDLLNQISFMQRVARQNTTVVGVTRSARTEVSREADRLAVLENRDRALADEVLAERNQAAALQSALLNEQLVELARKSAATSRYHSVDSRLGALQARLAAIEERQAQAAERAAITGNANVGGLAVDTAGMVQPPADAPAAVAQIIAAGNAIATLPYIWGGGHASFHADGYDCSGSVSYVLAAAGLLSAPMVSGDFESYGDPGPGSWVTIYANAGHVWMEVAGWRFDTVALAEDGTRWAQGGGEFAGFVVRHPPGL
ncbi:MAG: coiled-coil domain-containing protein [Solirubrobacteraceae bacterium]